MTESDSSTTAGQDSRRTQILHAALDVIVDRGYADTRIADVAERLQVSPALVMYYFKTKDRLLADATRYAEDLWYVEGTRRMRAVDSAAGRLEQLVRMTCLPQGGEALGEPSSMWLSLWARAARHDTVREVREEFDQLWREAIRQVVRDGQAAGEFGEARADDFALTFAALLDGLAIQIVLADPVADANRCFEMAMNFAARALGFSWPTTSAAAPSGGVKSRQSLPRSPKSPKRKKDRKGHRAKAKHS